jgi:phosphoribosylamine--glycine ligase
MKILVIGSGGREHCLCWKIAQSKLVEKIYCAPGNGGTSLAAENIAIDSDDITGLLKFAKDRAIDLTIVGPEAPLADGIVDVFIAHGLKIFGPDKESAKLESSKVFAKETMRKYKIPTADFAVFNEPQAAKKYIKEKGVPIVIKADGLAAGKGVVVAKTIQEASDAIDLIMVKKEFGPSGDRVVIEEYLDGQEASILAITDGKNIVLLESSQDHKCIFDGDKGPNTGGMGAYSPAPLINQELSAKISEKIFKPLIQGLAAEGKPYRGVLYAGIMVKNNEPYVLEFNVRFGDPEAQSILPKLKSDLIEVMLRAVDGKLEGVKLEWDNRFCLSVVLASAGYPGDYETGKVIGGLGVVGQMKDIFIFHAGTKMDQRRKSDKVNSEEERKVFITNGGRVLNVCALGDTIGDARDKVYGAIKNIFFHGLHYRNDIGNKALKS